MSEVVCRWCGASSHYACPPLCTGDEEHEWGTWTPGEKPAPEAACTHCDGNGQTWDPTAPGNVGGCSHCGDSGSVPIEDAGAQSATQDESGNTEGLRPIPGEVS